MPGKSRYGKGKHSSPSKRRKDRQHHIATAVQQPAAVQASKPGATVTPYKVTPGTSVPAPPAKSPAARYPYIRAELARIGILTGVILVILFVLAFVLPKL